jgi:uncharacterized membrane protein
MGRPTHPIFVIFPLAFFVGALALDVLSRVGVGLTGAPLAATYAVLGGLVGAVFAIATGLLDRAAMRPGSQIRRVATRHMILQLTATGIFLVDLLVRWSDRRVPHSEPLWIVLSALGIVAIIVGGDVGFTMVFKMGARVEAAGPALEGPATPPGGAAAQVATPTAGTEPPSA